MIVSLDATIGLLILFALVGITLSSINPMWDETSVVEQRARDILAVAYHAHAINEGFTDTTQLFNLINASTHPQFCAHLEILDPVVGYSVTAPGCVSQEQASRWVSYKSVYHNQTWYVGKIEVWIRE